MKSQNNDILDDIRRVRDILGRIPTGADYRRNGKFGLTTVKSRFGSWNACLLRLFQTVVRCQNKKVESKCEFCGKLISFVQSSPRRFCSHSCSNKGVKRRKRKIRICLECGKEAQQRRSRCTECIANTCIENKTIGEFRNKCNNANRYSEIRIHARKIAKNIPDSCFVSTCGYNKSVVVCHKVSISEFPDTALVSEVNALSNLVKLCRNHHWELDNGLLKINGPVVQLLRTTGS